MAKKSNELNAVVTRKEDLTDNLFIVWVRPEYEIPDFLPGQYVAIGLPPEAARIEGSEPEKEEPKPGRILKRTYSIGSAPHEKEALEFYVALVPDGCLTPRLAALDEGDKLWIAPKITGTFNLEPAPPESDLVFLATGTGLAPFISMLRDPATWPSIDRKITLVHGVRYENDFAYEQELRTLESERPNFSYLQTVSRPSEGFEGTRGYVQDFITRGDISIDPASTHVFLCGNPAMIDSVEELLVQKSFTVHSKKTPGNLHLERYW